MIAAANFSSASWISGRRSKRILSLPKLANHLCVRSTTQQCWPSRSPRSIPPSANPAGNASVPQLVVVVFVGAQLCWSFTGASRQACNRRIRVHAPLKHFGVVPVRAADQDHQGDASGIYNDVSLGAELASVRRVGAHFLPPGCLVPRSHQCWPTSNRSGHVHAGESVWLGATVPRHQRRARYPSGQIHCFMDGGPHARRTGRSVLPRRCSGISACPDHGEPHHPGSIDNAGGRQDLSHDT